MGYHKATYMPNISGDELHCINCKEMTGHIFYKYAPVFLQGKIPWRPEYIFEYWTCQACKETLPHIYRGHYTAKKNKVKYKYRTAEETSIRELNRTVQLALTSELNLLIVPDDLYDFAKEHTQSLQEKKGLQLSNYGEAIAMNTYMKGAVHELEKFIEIIFAMGL